MIARFCYKIQKVNMREHQRQYRTTFVTKLIEGMDGEMRPVDRWVTIEAYPERLKQHLYKRVIEVVGRCRLIN